MKKLLCVLLSILMLLPVLAACSGNDDPTTTAAPDTTAEQTATPSGQPTETPTETVDVDAVTQELLDKAAKMIDNYYNPVKNKSETVSGDFTLPASTLYGKYTVNIAWTVESGENLAAITVSEDGKTANVAVNASGEGGEFKLKGVVTCEGFTAEIHFTYKVTSQLDVLLAAYDLKPGAKMESSSTLTGKIVKIDTPYDAGYSNVTVTIVVGDHTDKPIMCYRLKGEGADVIKIGDVITVTGIITNYVDKNNVSTIEFTSGCKIDKINSVAPMTDDDKIAFELGKISFEPSYDKAGDFTVADKGATYPEVTFSYTSSSMHCLVFSPDNAKMSVAIGDVNESVTVTVTASCGDRTGTKTFSILILAKALTMQDIVDMAYALEGGKALAQSYTLTGKIVSVDTPFDGGYQNVTVTIAVEGREDKPIMCYRLKGDGADVIKAGDVITVSGIIKNYVKGDASTIEFDAGCTLDRIDAVSEMTAEQKVDAELSRATLPASVSEETVVDLAAKGATYEDVTFTWTSDNELATVADGKLTLRIGDANVTATVTLTARCEGVTKTKNFGVVLLAKELTVQDIVDMAYALEGGKALSQSYTLTGKITAVNTPFDSGYNNVTVTIAVEGREDKPIMCYRMKGEGADTIKVNDVITVSGILKNYVKGDVSTIEFDAGCTLDKIDAVAEMTAEQKIDAELAKITLPASVSEETVVDLAAKGATYEDVTFTWSSDNAQAVVADGKLTLKIGAENAAVTITLTAKCGDKERVKQFKVTLLAKELTMQDIVDMAYALEGGKALSQSYTLTGKIIRVDTPFDSGYNNVTVTIAVEGREDKPIMCYRMKGEGADKIKVNDVITVSGILKNYVKDDKSTIEFDAGCTLDRIDEVAEMTAEQKIDAELAKIALPASVSEETVLDAPAKGAEYGDVTFTWSSDNAQAVVADGKLTLKIGAENAEATVKVTAKCGDVTKEKEYKILILAKELTMQDIVDMAYDLEGGKALTQSYTLTGKITAVNTPFDSGYNNVTVTIAVEGREDKPIMCYRMKGEGADKIKVNDVITVSGILKNYVKDDKSTIEFDAGCMLDRIDAVAEMTAEQKIDAELAKIALPASVSEESVVDAPAAGAEYTDVTFTWASDNELAAVADGKLTLKIGTSNVEATVTLTAKCGDVTKEKTFKIALLAKELTMQDIVDMAYDLEGGKALSQSYTLTGKIIRVDTPFDSRYNNVTVTITVEGREDKPIMCYRMKGEGADKIKVNDVITVSGILKNYVKDDKSTIEFDASCTLDRIDEVAELTVEDKIALELAAISVIPATVTENTVVDLVLTGKTYTDVTFSWASDNAQAVVADGKLTFTKAEAATSAVITVTATCEDKTAAKEFTVSIEGSTPVVKTPEEIVAEAYALEAGKDIGTQTLTGRITKINTPYDNGFKNVTVTIVIGDLKDNPIQCFRMKGEGADTIKENDVITVTGKLKNYNGTIEFDAGCTLDRIDEVAPLSDEQKAAIELAGLEFPAQITADTEFDLPLVGTVYDDVEICWESSSDLAVVSDDKLTVTIGTENVIVSIEATVTCGDAELTKQFKIMLVAKELTEEDILAILFNLKDQEVTTQSYTLTGTVTAVDTAYNAQYQNVTVTIAVGDKSVMCYRLAAKKDVTTDADLQALAVGSVITVTGTFKNHKGTFEFNQGCTLDKVG